MTSQDIIGLNVKDITFIDNIKSMAVIGSSKRRNFFFLRNHAEHFKGDIYIVHPTIKEIPDFDNSKIYPSLRDIPGDVDFVFISVPSSQIINVIDDCVEKGVKLASIFTAGFSDAGTKEGIQLEKELLSHAQNKVRLLGPNGMGLFFPKLGIAWRRFPNIAGNIGLITQSGGVCNIAIYMAAELGLYFSKVFSFGNGTDLDFVDILYHQINDPEIKIILCYVEGINEDRGKDLMKVFSLNKKPIVVLKGGRTKTGSIAAKTHTASITGENKIWKTIFKQYNLIEVDSLEQLIYTGQLISYYGLFEIDNVAVFSISGGYGVILVDILEEVGIKVPQFSQEIQDKINSKIFIVGTSANNPLDVAAQIYRSQTMHDIMDLALSDKKIDALILDMPSFYFSVKFHLKKDLSFEDNMINNFCLGHKHNKPLIPIIQQVNYPEDRVRAFKKLTERKVPVFANPLDFIPLLPKISKFTKRMKMR